MMLLAHAGHWLVNVLYVVPLLVVVVAIGVSALRARDEREGGDEF